MQGVGVRRLRALPPIIAVCGTLGASAATAQAAPGAAASGALYSLSHSVAETPGARSWYGWQTLISDVLGLAALSLAIPTASVPLGVAGMALLWLGAPAIHHAHDNYGGAGLSFALRLGATLVVLGGGAVLAEAQDTKNEAVGFGLGLGIAGLGLLALLTSIVFDAAVKSYELKFARSAALQPWVDPRSSAGLQLVAAF